jgi:hypothetical protein
LSVNFDQLALDEPLSPELVLVLSPELRAQAIARLGPPAWPKPQLRPYLRKADVPAPVPVDVLAIVPAEVRAAAAAAAVREPIGRSLGRLLLGRAVQLALIFVAVTVLTVAMSLIAQAAR